MFASLPPLYPGTTETEQRINKYETEPQAQTNILKSGTPVQAQPSCAASCQSSHINARFVG